MAVRAAESGRPFERVKRTADRHSGPPFVRDRPRPATTARDTIRENLVPCKGIRRPAATGRDTRKPPGFLWGSRGRGFESRRPDRFRRRSERFRL